MDKKKIDKYNLIILIMICSGIFGFIYELLFYRIDLGYFVKRGSSYGPWIPIYVFGGLFIYLLTKKYRDKPLLVFLISLLVSGILEYGTGMFFYEVLGKRLWDYNVEIWNFGNINGYICLRSVLFFGVSGLILNYLMIPMLNKIIKKVDRYKLRIITTILILLFFIDVIVYMILH